MHLLLRYWTIYISVSIVSCTIFNCSGNVAPQSWGTAQTHPDPVLDTKNIDHALDTLFLDVQNSCHSRYESASGERLPFNVMNIFAPFACPGLGGSGVTYFPQCPADVVPDAPHYAPDGKGSGYYGWPRQTSEPKQPITSHDESSSDSTEREDFAETIRDGDMESRPYEEPVYNFPQALWLQELVTENWHVCRSYFEGTPLARALQEIEPLPATEAMVVLGLTAKSNDNDFDLDILQLRIARVFGHIGHWRWCNWVAVSPSGKRMLGLYEDRNVYIFSSACRANSLYGIPSTNMDVRPRVVFVMAHEWGHALDDLLGRLHANARERRATEFAIPFVACEIALYKTYVMEAKSYVMESLGSREKVDGSVDESDDLKAEEAEELFTCYLEQIEKALDVLTSLYDNSWFKRILLALEGKSYCTE